MVVTITLNTGIVIGTAVGGAVALLVVSTILTLALLKLRQRRFAARNGAHRPSRFTLNISNPELSSMPRVRSVLRHPLRNPYGPGWVGVSSLDSLAQNSVLYNQFLGGQPQRSAHKPTQIQSRRLQKAYPKSLSPTRTLSLSKIPEPSTSLLDRPSNIFGPSRAFLTRGAVSQPSPLSTVTSAEPEKIKTRPYFWEQQRSFSSNAAVQFSPSRQAADLPRSDSRPVVRRSVSLHSQLAGPAPTEPLPSPPLSCIPRLSRLIILKDNRGCDSRTSMRSSTSFASTLNEEPRSFSCTETDYTSNSFQPFQSNKNSKRSAKLYNDSELGDLARAKMFATDSSQSAATNTKLHLNPQKPFRASIEQYQLRREKSSSLSLSLVDDNMFQTPTRSDSTASKSERTSREVFKLCNMSPEYIESFTTTNVDSSKMLYKDGLIPKIDFPLNYKRASTSIFKEVSGNEIVPFHAEFQKRPTSLPLNQPVKWKQPELIRPPTTRDRSKGHKRQNCVRISYTSPRNSKLIPPAEEPADLEENSSKLIGEARSKTNPEEKDQLRPPSRPFFNPQLTWAPIQTMDRRPTGDYDSQTMNMYNFYKDGLHREPDSTPTRRPSQRSKPAASRTDTFKTPDQPNWPFPASKSIGDFRSSVFSSRPPSTTAPVSEAGSRPSSLIFENFPNPPFFDAPRQIQGPRAPPARYQYPRRGRSPNKRSSPLREGPRFKSSTPSVSPLKESVRELRRMKSDLSILSNLEKSFYLNIGRDSTDMETCLKEDGKVSYDHARTQLKAKDDIPTMATQLGHRTPVTTTGVTKTSEITHRAPTTPTGHVFFSHSSSTQPSPSGFLTPKATATISGTLKPPTNITKPHAYTEDIFEPPKMPHHYAENIFNRALSLPPISIPGHVTSIPTISTSSSPSKSTSPYVATHYVPAPPPLPTLTSTSTAPPAPLYPTLCIDLASSTSKPQKAQPPTDSPTIPSPRKTREIQVRTPTRGSKDWRERQEYLSVQKEAQVRARIIGTIGTAGNTMGDTSNAGEGGGATGGWKWPSDVNCVAVDMNHNGPKGRTEAMLVSETSRTFERIVKNRSSPMSLTPKTKLLPGVEGREGGSRDVEWGELIDSASSTSSLDAQREAREGGDKSTGFSLEQDERQSRNGWRGGRLSSSQNDACCFQGEERESL
ncbi:MAG: hypothetical protein MMC33_003900 [Icmadophila ericetorum]|nr:hypothetical protein [Icmadophila ericetorum]